MGVSAVAHAQTTTQPVPPITTPVTTAPTPPLVPKDQPAVPTNIPAIPGGAPAQIGTTSMAPSPMMTKKERLQEAVKKLENSLEVRITNLDSLAARIQTRIAKLQQGGKDMTAATVKLAEAQKAIAVAKAELAILKKADATMVASKKPATAFATIKTKTAKNVTVKIKAAHKALVDTVVLMKGQGVAATTTPAVR